MHDLTGKSFGRLTVLYVSGRKHNRLLWHCKCECGSEIDLTSNRLLHPQGTKSCGCLRKEVAAEKATKHGMTKTKIYDVWSSMKQRCIDPNCEGYQWYGARGIKFCDKWQNFEGFYEDMGATYKRGLTIDRIDVDGDYCKENCRWVTPSVQANNTRRCVYITVNGETDSAMNMCKKYHSNYDRVVREIKRGKDPTEMIKKYKIS